MVKVASVDEDAFTFCKFLTVNFIDGNIIVFSILYTIYNFALVITVQAFTIERKPYLHRSEDIYYPSRTYLDYIPLQVPDYF